MKLIRELTEETKILTEEVGGKKSLFVEGICIQMNTKNRNRRIYPKENVKGEIERYIKECVEQNRALGELSHPVDSPSINLDRVSHIFTSLKEDGDNYICKAKILDTPMGNIARGLMEGGAKIGISTRALGSVKQNRDGIMEVQKDFRLSTAGDLVGDPSAPDAWLNAINENKEWVFVNGVWSEQTIDDMKNTIKTKNSDVAILDLWEQFLIGIATK